MKVILEETEKVSSSYCANSVEHIIKEEKRMWELDGLAESTIETQRFQMDGSSGDLEKYTEDDN